MMAMDNYFLFPPWDCDWDPHTFGSAGDLHQQLIPLPLATESPASSSQASTGYLQDAVAGWSSRSKRRRLANSSPSHVNCSAPLTTGDLQDILQGFLDSRYFGDPMLDQSRRPIEPGSSSPSGKSLQCSKELQQKDIQRPNSKAKALTLKASERRGCNKKKNIAYPFAVVKPGGVDGGVTLDDINAQLLMRPRRPVRHPVGEFAGRPQVVSPAGPGLSGKAVVSLTRIQTRGRGTITIIRTKG